MNDQTTLAANRLPWPSLRLALRADALITTVNGLAYLIAASPIASALEVPEGFLQGAGAFLVVFGVLVGMLSAVARPNRGGVAAVIAVNVAWTVGSILLAVFGWLSPSAIGTVWTLMQALTVGGFAALQAGALSRAAS